MRFLEQGADIPDEFNSRGDKRKRHVSLWRWRVFSIRFAHVQGINSERLRQARQIPDEEAAEQNALKASEYDRALRSLEKRTRLPRTRSLVRETGRRAIEGARRRAIR